MDVHRTTTHVIANRTRRTAKVRVAARNPNIKIVTTAWLFDCVSQWQRLDETPYLIEVEPEQKAARAISPMFEESKNGELSSSEEETATAEAGANGHNSLHLNTDVPAPEEDDEQEDSLSPGDQVTDDQWKAMMAEIDEASDTEDGTDGYDSDASQKSETSDTKKRKRTASRPASQNSTDGEEDGSANESTGSKLQRRKRRALARTSSLTNVAHATNGNGIKQSPTKMKQITTVHNTEQPLSSPAAPSETGTDDSDDGLNAAMEAELAAQLDAADTDPE